MVEVSILWQGNLRTEATHKPSTTSIITDAPVDNHGLGSTFSPTDLVATALGSCMLTIMGIFAKNHEIDLDGSSVSVTKHMSTSPRRIGKLEVHISLPLEQDHPQSKALERAALACPVHKSLHPDIEIPVQFHWRASQK